MKDQLQVKTMQIVYLLLLPVFFLLHNYNDLFGFIPPGYLFIFGLCTYLFAGIVFLIARLITGSITVASFITFCVLLFTLFFGAWYDGIKSISPISGRYLVVLPVTVLFIGGIAWYFIKKRQWLPAVSTYLSLVVLILCGLEIINFVLKYRQYRNDHNLMYSARPISNNYVSCSQPDSSKPDIFFIIFDEYTDNRTLSTLWHYDNSEITRWLTDKGFYIPDSSKANYSFTPYSISSILNMNYFDVSKGSIDDRIYKCLKGVRSISDNETIGLLQQEHYNIQFFCPFKTSFNNLDLAIEHEFDHYAKDQVFDQTFPGRLIRDFGWKYQPAPATDNKKIHSDNRLLINRIKSAASVSVDRPPQFVYGHLMITHKPHIYDAAGKVLTTAPGKDDTAVFKTYVNQVKQANTVIQELVTHILAHNRPNTLIILMGDHGYRYLPLEQSAYYFPNFSAFYLPGKNPGRDMMNISAVNTFRIVFNQYFCQNLPLLKDSSILVKF